MSLYYQAKEEKTYSTDKNEANIYVSFYSWCTKEIL